VEFVFSDISATDDGFHDNIFRRHTRRSAAHANCR
jgi:hypothetical protein